jgi:hypothetical protein
VLADAGLFVEDNSAFLGTSEALNANKGSTIATKTLEFVNQVKLFARVSS